MVRHFRYIYVMGFFYEIFYVDYYNNDKNVIIN